MADIFISYSSHDRAKASALCAKLRAEGRTVWIDESGISAATQWTDEIVKAIEGCRIFIILLSDSAISSQNVIKELKLASEEKKHIIPVELESVEITTAIKYQLAGIQRVPFKDFERVSEAVHRFLGEQVAPGIKVSQPIKRKSIAPRLVLSFLLLAIITAAYFFNAKKSKEITVLPPDAWMPHVVESKIAVLPFEFLSSEKDDEYFADGLTSEVISSLSHLQGMIVTSRKEAMDYKGKKTDTKAIASSLGVRYIVDGTIQREGKNVKISAELLDIESGKTMLTEKFEGTTNDRIRLQERLALSIAFELQGSIGGRHEMDTNIIRQMTSSPEAAEAIREGDKYVLTETEEGWTKSLPYFRKAAALDPQFVYAYYQIAVASLRRYPFSHLKSDLEAADSAMNTINRLNPSFRLIHYCDRLLAGIKGDREGEIREQKILVARAPEDALGYDGLASYYYLDGKFDLAAANYEEVVKRNITNMAVWYSLIFSLNTIGDTVKLNKYCTEVFPLYERYLEKHPSEILTRISYAYCLQCQKKKDESNQQLDIVLKSTSNISALDYYNVACIYSLLNEPKQAIHLLSISFEKGADLVQNSKSDPDLNNIRNMPEFKAKIKEMERAK